MTCQEELRRLRRDLHHYRVTVRYGIEEGTVVCVFVTGEGVKKEYWDSILSAAEYLRRLLRECEITAWYGHHYPHKGQRFSNGRWRERTTS